MGKTNRASCACLLLALLFMVDVESLAIDTARPETNTDTGTYRTPSVDMGTNEPNADTTPETKHHAATANDVAKSPAEKFISYHNAVFVQSNTDRKQHDTDYDSMQLVSNFGQPESKQGKSSSFIQPEVGDKEQCKLQLTSRSIDTFRHDVYYGEKTYVYLRLNPQDGVNITAGNDTVGENVWVWTFFGKDGSFEYLKWPIEFGIYSLGLLYDSVVWEPLDLYLERESGDCSNIVVGNATDDLVIAKALKNLTVEMMKFDEEKYGPSFYCYKKRMFIRDYVLCKHIVCPIEALQHECCVFFWNKAKGAREMECGRQKYEYDPMWWAMPSIISLILFSYCPVWLMYVAYKCTSSHKGSVVLKTRSAQHMYHIVDSDNGAYQNLDAVAGPAQEHEEVILLAGFRHVTLRHTILSPFLACFRTCAGDISSVCFTLFARIVRMVFPISSMSIILLQIVLDHYYLHEFVLENMTKGVPMGFRSMLAGYRKSQCNFLPYIGGPYVAIGVYIMIACMLLWVPKSPVDRLVNCLNECTVDNERSPLCLSTRTISQLGSDRVKRENGYNTLYHLFMAQFSMLLNIRYWKHCLSLQARRWDANANSNFTACKLCFTLLLPFYLIVCFVELLLSIILYGLPIISFGSIIIRGYTISLTRCQDRDVIRGCFKVVCYLCLSLCLIAGVAFFLFMFCTIFLDANLFFTRIIIFTFTGIIVNPKTSYGYMIFSFTVFYYLWDSVRRFSATYDQLFKDTIHTAQAVQDNPTGDHHVQLIHNLHGQRGITKNLFEFVIEVHRPRRTLVFLTFFKTAIVIAILWMLIHLLLSTDKFRELHVSMHVVTALFICALPQIAKVVCRGKENKARSRHFRRELSETIRGYCECGYVQNLGSESDSD